MRTTIDLPDSLFRQVKARAALQGRTLKEILADYVEQGLGRQPDTGGPDRPQRSAPPILIPATGKPLPLLTNAEIEQLLEKEEVERCETSWT